ncbi:MAG: methyltransferase domain-containing protein [Candidatus Azambacteria bacterium]|nr:methyltransferase domain-containing protein [Candidatus Azambacteria bacterium]
MFKILKKQPWFYTWNFLRDNSQFIKGDVIDVGCGNSKYKSMILKFDNVKKYTGLDFFVSNNADIVTDLNKKLPVENAKYDSAICISVIEHLLEPQLALDEIYRVLKPGGYLLLTTPWIYPFHGEPSDCFRYSRFALKHMLEKSGFKLVSVQPTGGKFRIFLTFLNKWAPIFGKVVRFMERFIPVTPILADWVDSEFLNTPSHRVIAEKNV